MSDCGPSLVQHALSMQSFLVDLPEPVALNRLPLARLPCGSLALLENHGSAELLKEPARPPRLEYFKYFAIRETFAGADGCRESLLWHSTSFCDWDILYTIYSAYQEVRWEGSELAYLLGPLRRGSASRKIALAYDLCMP